MLIRFSLSNIFSFDDMKEFNMLPSPKYKRLDSHRYTINNFDVLKMASIYGENGAGKSNLVKSLDLLKSIVLYEELPLISRGVSFKFRNKASQIPQILAIEFFQDGIPFYYALEILNNRVKTEELYQSGLGKEKDVLIFERTTNEHNKIEITFLDAFESDTHGKILKEVIIKNLAKPYKPILKLLTTLNSPLLEKTHSAFNWFKNSLEIIYPNSKPNGLAHRIDSDPSFKRYADDMVESFDIGIGKFILEKKNLKDFFGEDNDSDIEEVSQKIELSPNKMIALNPGRRNELLVVKEDQGTFVKQLKLEHTGANNTKVSFDLEEESDGTIRLLDFIPAFKDLVTNRKVIVIDEIESSIHPLLIKELIKKFSSDDKTKGQLIFTTHESNLLDQAIFRQDEIWFAEKNKSGSTELYSLSDFKEHNTIDIRKGYLNGRYGSIPFLANLQDLNWHKYDTQK